MTWVPHEGPQEEFCSRGEFEVLMGGAAGPGKTDCLITLALRHVDKPNYRGLILRRTFPRLEEIIDRCHQLYPKLGAYWKATERRWYFPSGAFVKLGHMQHEDDKRDYQGKEYQFIGWDELTEFTETQYSFVTKSRARTSDSSIPVRIRATTNPGGTGHRWVKSYFIDCCPPSETYIEPDTGLSRRYIPARVYDNPTLMLADPGYEIRLRALPEIERRRLLDGDWSIFEGQVFQSLNERIHACDPFELPPDWEYFGVLDWGYAKPFSYGVYAVDYDDVLYRVMEWYGCKDGEVDVGLKMTAADVADGILEREGKLGVKIRSRIADPSIWNKLPKFRQKEVIGKDICEDMESRGVYFEKADNDRIQGWQQVHRRLQIDQDIDEETGEVKSETPQFIAFNDQHHFWRLMPEIQADENKPEDIDTRQEDHIADEVRYASMFRPVKPKPRISVPAGSFQATRAKHLRASKLAKRLGISINQAYQRVK